MKKTIKYFFILLILAICNCSKAQVFENYSIYSIAPGISSSKEDTQYSGFSISAHGAAGTGYFHGEVSSTIGFSPEVFMNEYLTLDLAAGYPFKITDNAEALVALSPFSVNLTVDGNIGLATLLKFRYGKIFLESKLVLTEYKEKTEDPFFLNNSYYGIRRVFGNAFGVGIRYSSFSQNYNMLGFYISYGFEDNG
jgi:hypothetical protein